jgi:hypothetical protein
MYENNKIIRSLQRNTVLFTGGLPYTNLIASARSMEDILEIMANELYEVAENIERSTLA